MGLLLRLALFAAVVVFPTNATAQNAPQGHRLLEAHIGQGWFFDESAIRHDVIGLGAARTVSRRLWLRATLTHMRGPGRDRDWLLVGHVSFDIVHDRPTRPVVPFVSLGAGVMRHTDVDYGRNISGIGPTFFLSTGLRIRLGDRWFMAPEAGVGLEAQARAGVTVGIRK